jgi:hypothetical protein
MTYNYESIENFELRSGLFNDPNRKYNGSKFELRILHEDPDMMEMLKEKIIEMLKEK